MIICTFWLCAIRKWTHVIVVIIIVLLKWPEENKLQFQNCKRNNSRLKIQNVQMNNESNTKSTTCSVHFFFSFALLRIGPKVCLLSNDHYWRMHLVHSLSLLYCCCLLLNCWAHCVTSPLKCYSLTFNLHWNFCLWHTMHSNLIILQKYSFLYAFNISTHCFPLVIPYTYALIFMQFYFSIEILLDVIFGQFAWWHILYRWA